MSSLLSWCSEKRADVPAEEGAAAAVASSEVMMAAEGQEFGKSLVVRTDYPVPPNFLAPGAHEVVVTVAYVAINPVDWKLLSGNLPGAKVPCIPCSDFSGQVLRVGSAVTKVAAGDYVAGFGKGCAAHLCVVEDTNVVKLSGASHLKAASTAGVVTLTASECLRKAAATAGSTVVVIGASGGVGHVIVQMAKNIGACVIAVCSTANGQFVKDCGADIVLFYDGGPNFDFSAALNGRPIDAVIDCVGGDEYFQSACRCAYPLGAYKGRFVTIVGPEPDVQKLGAGMFASFAFKLATRAVAQMWQPSYAVVLGFPHLAQDLAANVAMIESGKVKIQINKEFALSDINAAFEQQKTHRSVGKNILVVKQM